MSSHDSVENGAAEESDACPRCGSTKLMQDVHVLDSGQYALGNLSAHVFAQPDAFIFKESTRAQLTATICSQCGHAELSVSNAMELWELWKAYQKSRS